MEYKHLSSMVGQERFKKEVKFFLDGYKKTSYMPNMLLSSPRGCGKTEMAKRIAAELKEIEKSRGNKKNWLQLNGSDLSSGEVLWTKILPIIHDVGYLTIFIDECSQISPTVQNIFLSIFNIDKDRVSYYHKPDGTVIEFDFKKITFIMATTRANMVHPDLLDRLRRFELDLYSEEDLSKIIQLYSPEVSYDKDTLLDIATTVRCNARKAQSRAEEIRATGITSFGKREWQTMKQALSIYPLGLSKHEKEYLLHLFKSGVLPLNEISHRLNLEPKAVSGDIESYLKHHGLVTTIQKGRTLTGKGIDLVKKLQKT